MAPAVLALTAYSLLPLVRSTYEGLSSVAHPVKDAGRAMGLSRHQLLWQVEVPLAAPVLLSGVKVMLVQAVGLTAVAALIGAGGLGALMFEGLFSSAVDLVVLAVVPIVALAWCTEVFFQLVQTAILPLHGNRT
jgi:osmoprotectant transport system permease protein